MTGNNLAAENNFFKNYSPSPTGRSDSFAWMKLGPSPNFVKLPTLPQFNFYWENHLVFSTGTLRKFSNFPPFGLLPKIQYFE
jgi:hypothetical protein